MSAEDAADNTARAEAIREHVALCDTIGADRVKPLPRDLLLSAANALDAQGVKGWAVARLTARYDGSASETLADMILEATDTADDTLARFRRELGDGAVNDMIEELEEQR